jgi:hypothetical protein
MLGLGNGQAAVDGFESTGAYSGRWRNEPACGGGTVRNIDFVGDPVGCGAPCGSEMIKG